MPFRFRIDRQRGVVFTVSEGNVGTAEVRDYLERLQNDPAYRSGFHGLIDVRHATSTITAGDLRDMAEWVRRRPSESESRRAVVVSSDEHYGLMRMFEALTESGPTRYRVFRDLEEARAWVEGEPEEE